MHALHGHNLELFRFTFVLDNSIAKLAFSQKNVPIVYYDLMDMSLNSSAISLCALVDSRLEQFVPEPLIRMDFAINGVDFEFLQYIRINATVPKTSMVFYDLGITEIYRIQH